MKNTRFSLLFRQNLIGIFLVLALVYSGTPGLGYSQSKSQLSSSERLQVFNKVWNLINTRYYDPKMNGVNWLSVQHEYRPLIVRTDDDSQFYDVIKRMVNKMNDSHTRFLTPLEARQRRARTGVTVGMLISKIGKRMIVERVLPDATGDLAKVKPGMIVRTVDGVPIEARFNKVRKEIGNSSSERALEILALKRIMRGAPGTYVKVGLTDENGNRFVVDLVRRTVPQNSEAIGRKLDSGIGYMLVTSFKAPISEKFKKALLKLQDTSGLILDLRYNGGGTIKEVLKMVGAFINERREFGKFLERSARSKQKLRTFSAGKKGGQLYANPLVILTSKYSASGSELFASSLQEIGRAKVVGAQTCGCMNGISRRHSLQDGSELHVSDIGFISAKGNIYERIGVTPDNRIELTINDLRNGFDRGLAEAEKMLTEATNSAD